MTTPIPQFEEGSLEYELIKGIFSHMSTVLGEAAADIYRSSGVSVQGQLNVMYKVEDIRALADFIRTEKDGLYDATQAMPYHPTHYYCDPR